MFDHLNNGYCPQCLLEDKYIELQSTHDIVYECKNCNLQLEQNYMGPEGVGAIILKKRGKGEFQKNPEYGWTKGGRIILRALLRTDEESTRILTSEKELREYIENEVEQIPKK